MQFGAAIDYSMNLSACNTHVGTVPVARKAKSISAEQLAADLGFPVDDVLNLAEAGEFDGAIRLPSGIWRFHQDCAQWFWDQRLNTTSLSDKSHPTLSESLQQVKTIKFNHEKSANSVGNIFEKVQEHVVGENSRPSAVEAEHLKEELIPEILVQQPLNVEQGQTKVIQTPTQQVTENISTEYETQKLKINQILIAQLNNSDLLGRGKRVLSIVDSPVTGTKLEVSKKSRKLVIKTNAKRCELLAWKSCESIPVQHSKEALSDFECVFKKLERMPSTNEYQMFSKKLNTIGDAINQHLEFNIKNKHGEGSKEWNTITALVENHLSQPKQVELPSGKQKSVALTEEKLTGYSEAEFKAYLNGFIETNGLHDKIVSRVKAAVNFCLKEGMINLQDFRHFHDVARVGKQRHVVIPNADLEEIFNYLATLDKEDFVFFMLIESSGNFRTMQTMSIKYKHIDFKNNKVVVKAKGGKLTTVPLSEELSELLQHRMDNRKDTTSRQSKFVFPSYTSESGHRESFEDDWNKLRQELNFYHLDSDGNIVYQYRLHDFRETLLERLDGCDDPTLAGMLGHLSSQAIKHYRKARPRQLAAAAEKGLLSLPGASELMQRMQN